MRVKVSCPYCDEKTYKDESWAVGEVHQDGYLQCRCKLGHETVVGIEEPRFVLLFDIAARAYLDGYYREAVSTMNSAIERACEFFLEVVSEARGIPARAFERFWGTVKNRSEAQLGVFLLAYLYEHGSPCAFFEEELLVHGKRASISNFRNRVIHQGYIPSQLEAYCLGEKAYKWLTELSATLQSAHFEAVHIVQEEARALQFEACQKEGHEIVFWAAGGTIINWTERIGPKEFWHGIDKIGQRTFSEGLLDLNYMSIWEVGTTNALPDGIERPVQRECIFHRSMTAISHPPKKRSRK